MPTPICHVPLPLTCNLPIFLSTNHLTASHFSLPKSSHIFWTQATSLSTQRGWLQASPLEALPIGKIFPCDWLSVPPLSGAVWRMLSISSLQPQKQLVHEPSLGFSSFLHLVLKDGPYTCRCDPRDRNWYNIDGQHGGLGCLLAQFPQTVGSCSCSALYVPVPSYHGLLLHLLQVMTGWFW